MIQGIIGNLHKIAEAAKGPDAGKAKETVALTRKLIQEANGGAKSDTLLMQLDAELSTWLAKWDVIVREPIGRQGMAKHARHWAERLK